MNRKLIDYLPQVLRNVPEFINITAAQQFKIEGAWESLSAVMDNQFIDTATADGVAVWEKELNITPLPTDTLEERKQRIKAAWLGGIVYTYKWLLQWLQTACGIDTSTLNLDEHTLNVSLPVSIDYDRILEDMRRYISANIFIAPTILLTKTSTTHCTGAAFRICTKQRMQGEAWSIQVLTDENGNVLTDENNYALYEEV